MRQTAIMQLVQEMSCQLIHYVNVKTMNCWFVQGQEAEDGLGCRRPMASQKRPRMDAAPRGRARHARLREARDLKEKITDTRGRTRNKEEVRIFFTTYGLLGAGSLDRRICCGPPGIPCRSAPTQTAPAHITREMSVCVGWGGGGFTQPFRSVLVIDWY